MRIVYVARFDQPNSNDDEGSILHGLRELGHSVEPVREQKGYNGLKVPDADLLLFHHWDRPDIISEFKIPKVFWYFDLVDWPNDPTLKSRCDYRKTWMQQTLPLVDIAFMTDGDYADRINRDRQYGNKAVHLMQGADQRIIGMLASDDPFDKRTDMLLVGGSNGGVQRQSFFSMMEEMYGNRITVVERGVYGRPLGKLIANHKLVIAPDSPVTDRYFSNRAYIMLGFAARLIHPYSKLLDWQFGDSVEYYRNRDQLHRLIQWALDTKEYAVLNQRQEALKKVKLEHTYKHRCETLINVVTQRLGIK